MPHGYQWSHEELRNAERAAEIQARAIVEAQRKERERQEKEDRMRRLKESSGHHSSSSSTPSTSRPRVHRPPTEREKEAIKAQVHSNIAKMRAEKAMAANFGSADYIHNRYGHAVWLGKVTEYRNKFGCSEEDAITLMVRDYKESEWAHLEDPLIEKFMGHRK
jgi:Xaa-Pro aminopeptidase